MLHDDAEQVDKFDYFMRDASGLHISTTFDSQRLMRNSRVAVQTPENGGDGRRHISFQQKEVWNLYELFHTRYTVRARGGGGGGGGAVAD
eukprot:COSAG01_NODE_4408_length_5059_cov_2.693565_10_plen_90_part_00